MTEDDDKEIHDEYNPKPPPRSLTNAEFEKVKEEAAKTYHDRISWLHPNMSQEEYELYLKQEQAWLKGFERDEGPDPPINFDDINHPPEPPAWEIHNHMTFEQIGRFFNWLFGRQKKKD
jgi:hypothetical protein